MKNLLFIFVTTMIFLCCQKENKLDATHIETWFLVYVTGNSGIDLLDPDSPSPKAINFDDIQTSSIINGKKVEKLKLFTTKMNASRGIALIKPSKENIFDKYCLQLGVGPVGKSNVTTTIVKWNKSDRTIFKTEFEKGDNYLVCSKLWINHKEVWNRRTGNDLRLITLKK